MRLHPCVPAVAFLLVAAAIAAPRAAFEFTSVTIPGVADTGTLFLDTATNSGLGDVRGSVNTRGGQYRALVRGTAQNPSENNQVFKNDPVVETLIETVIPEADVRNSRYFVGNKGPVQGLATGRVLAPPSSLF